MIHTRRAFLSGVSAIALASSSRVLAQIGGVKSTHNRGRAQIQSWFLQAGGDFPFLNVLKTAQAWLHIADNTSVSPSLLDKNGYPTTIEKNGVYTVFYIPPQASRPGDYVVTWDGNGTIFAPDCRIIRGSKTSTSGSGRFVFAPNVFAPNMNSRISIGISSIGTPRVTNLRVFHSEDEAELNANRMFGLEFRQRLLEANPGVLRFLDWQVCNNSNVTTWMMRKPVDYVYYSGGESRANIYAGITRNNKDDYSITFGLGAPFDKQTITVRFNESSSDTTPTLNLNESGAVPIKNPYGDPLTPNSRPLAGLFGTLVYDSDLGCWLKFGADKNSGGSLFLENGVPPEIMVRLCSEVGAHPYFCTPFLACDPATDYMEKLASFVRDNGPSWMIPRFEGCNETWNSSGGFYATRYGWNKALSYWGTKYDTHNWYGKTISILGQIVSSVHKNDRSKYQVLCGVQTGTGNRTSASNARLQSTRYVAEGGSAAFKWVTHVCCAQYMNTSEYATNQELIDAYRYSVADTAAKLELVTAYVERVMDSGGTNYNTIPKLSELYANWKAWGESHSVPVNGLCGYEGGWSPDYSLIAVTSPISGATKASQCVLTLAKTLMQGLTTNSGNPAVAGMKLKFDGISGMTELNGLTATVVFVEGDKVQVDVDSSAFATYLSGGSATYVGAPHLLNTFRMASKGVASLQTHLTTNYNNFISAGGEFPSCYNLSGSSYSSGGLLAGGQVWGVWDPDIYAKQTPPQWSAIVAFNKTRRQISQ